MTDGFVAIPVGRGDAFFFECGGFSGLIDGGGSKLKFPTMFQSCLNRAAVNVLVCTHNDSDHANGIIGFLESELECDEIWLPALWESKLDDLINKPCSFFQELAEDVGTLPITNVLEQNSARRSILESLGDLFARKQDSELEMKLKPYVGEGRVLPAVVQEEIELIIKWRDWMKTKTFFKKSDTVLVDPGQLAQYRLFAQAIKAAGRIDAIFRAARNRKIPIRWFQYSEQNASGGRSGQLEPLNAVEVFQGPRNIRSLVYLALSVANQQSLVFCSPSRKNWPGVVLSSDSDLRFGGQIPWNRRMLATAPHHGAESNAPAYGRFSADVKGKFQITWIRSDGNYPSRPGSSYLRINSGYRYCTVCRGLKMAKQAVRFGLQYGNFTPGSTRSCSCR